MSMLRSCSRMQSLDTGRVLRAGFGMRQPQAVGPLLEAPPTQLQGRHTCQALSTPQAAPVCLLDGSLAHSPRHAPRPLLCLPSHPGISSSPTQHYLVVVPRGHLSLPLMQSSPALQQPHWLLHVAVTGPVLQASGTELQAASSASPLRYIDHCLPSCSDKTQDSAFSFSLLSSIICLQPSSQSAHCLCPASAALTSSCPGFPASVVATAADEPVIYNAGSHAPLLTTMASRSFVLSCFVFCSTKD